jgi:hypothetical protein
MVRTYPELIAEKDEEIELWRLQYERLAKHVTFYKDMWQAQHAESASYQDVIRVLEAQVADQDNEIARLKKLADVQQNTVEFLHKLCELRTVMLNELEAKASIH